MLAAVILTSLFACITARINVGIFPEIISAVPKPDQSKFSCPPDQPECAFGCCPIPNGNCCWYGTQCCPPGYTCIIGFCVRGELENGNITFKSEKAVALKNQVTGCPSGTTTCGNDKCCLFPDAVCCSDGKHCCPNGYACDLEEEKCVKSVSVSKLSNDLGLSYSDRLEAARFEMIPKSTYKVCPGGLRSCPTYTSCCINEDGLWGCCPKPSSKRSNDCCDTFFGYLCCPYVRSTCTYIGCV